MLIEDLSVDDSIVYGVDLLFEFKDSIRKFSFKDFLQESITGSYDKNHIENICSEIHRVNNTLQKYLDSGTKPNIFQTKHIIQHLNKFGTPQFLDIMNNVFANPEEYDEHI